MSEADEPQHQQAPWVEAHAAADANGLDGYLDPSTGLFVMTRGYLLRRAHCCNSGCRHCPYRASLAACDQRTDGPGGDAP